MYSTDFLSTLYRQLLLIRAFELRCIKLYRQGLIRGYFHPYLGEEAIAAGVCAALRGDDYIVSTHRGQGHCIAREADTKRMMAELLGKATGYCAGRGGVASDIASLIQQDAFDYLDAPIEICAGKNTPIPFNLRLEDASVPQEEDIIDAVGRAAHAT